MTSINCASISFSRETSCGENILSALSNYFYLGGLQVQVLQDNKLSLDEGEISGWEMAWKVAVYVLTFPITAVLYVAYQTLLCCHQFTLPPKIEENHHDAGHKHGSHKKKTPCGTCPPPEFGQECAKRVRRTKSKTNVVNNPEM